jgi:hypothetical protein
VYQRALPHESRAGPGSPDSHPSWRSSAMGVLSAITRLPLCDPAFLQVARDRKRRSNALFERVGEGRSGSASKSSRGSSRHSRRHRLLAKSMPLTCTDPPLAQPTPHANPTSSTTSAQRAHLPPTNALAITDAGHHHALLSTPNLSEESSAPRRGHPGTSPNDCAADRCCPAARLLWDQAAGWNPARTWPATRATCSGLSAWRMTCRAGRSAPAPRTGTPSTSSSRRHGRRAKWTHSTG